MKLITLKETHSATRSATTFTEEYNLAHHSNVSFIISVDNIADLTISFQVSPDGVDYFDSNETVVFVGNHCVVNFVNVIYHSVRLKVVNANGGAERILTIYKSKIQK